MAPVSVTENQRLATLPLNRLEDEIGLLCSHLNAATYRLLSLVGELDRRDPWAGLGCKTGAHYLNWKCGIALGAAREKVRTARALRDLPRISDAFRLGRISYSKARSLTRVANGANEQGLLEIALGGTATHVDRIVRHYRQVGAADAPGEVYERREFTSYWDDDGALVFRGRLTAEQGAMLLQALDSARQPHDAANPSDTVETSGADALVHVCEGYLASASASAGAGSGRSADHYQVKITVPGVVLANAPEGDSVVSNDNARGTVGGTVGSTVITKDGSDPARVAVLDDGPALSLQTVRRLCCDGAIIPIVEDARGNPLRVGRKTRTVSPALRRAIERRDGGCRFPGCTQQRHVDAHHVVHWADGGDTDLSNLVSLCRKHHTWLHEGGYAVRADESEGFEFFNTRGRAIVAQPQKRSSGSVSALIEAHRVSGLALTPETAACQWDGRPPDYDHILFVLSQRPPGHATAIRPC